MRQNHEETVPLGDSDDALSGDGHGVGYNINLVLPCHVSVEVSLNVTPPFPSGTLGSKPSRGGATAPMSCFCLRLKTCARSHLANASTYKYGSIDNFVCSCADDSEHAVRCNAGAQVNKEPLIQDAEHDCDRVNTQHVAKPSLLIPCNNSNAANTSAGALQC